MFKGEIFDFDKKSWGAGSGGIGFIRNRPKTLCERVCGKGVFSFLPSCILAYMRRGLLHIKHILKVKQLEGRGSCVCVLETLQAD